jgi:putative ABC transport system substrate-binding protein
VSSDLVSKRFGLLKELVPQLANVAVLYNKRDDHELEFRDAEAATRLLGLNLVRIPVASPTEFEPSFRSMIEQKCGALYVVTSTFALLHREKLAQLSADYRLPTMFGFREFSEAGGLVSYGANLPDGWRRAAMFIDKILRGARPADLPVEQPTRFELVINARTAIKFDCSCRRGDRIEFVAVHMSLPGTGRDPLPREQCQQVGGRADSARTTRLGRS